MLRIFASQPATRWRYRDPAGRNPVARPKSNAIQREADPNSLTGQVPHREFPGSRIRHLVAVGRTGIMVDPSHSADGILREPAAEAHLLVNTDSAVVRHEVAA